MMSKLLSLILLLAAFNLVAQPVPPPATQAEVDAGVNRFKYVTPYTLANSPLAGGPTNGVTAATATNIANAAASTKQHGTSGLTNLSIAYTTNVFVYTTDNLPSVISNAANGTRLLLMPGSHQITSRFIFSNSLGQAGVNLFSKTNIQIEAAIPGTARIFTTNIGDMFFITNSARIAIRNLEIEGWVVTNYASTTLYSEPGVVWGAINLYDVADFELSGCRLINHHDHGLQGTGANINWNGASTNRILVFNNYFANIGSARTNAGITVDGTAVVPDGPWEIYNNTFEACLRAVEPYSDNDSSVRPWSGTRIQGNTFRNIIDSAILSAGSTNANYILAYDNQFIRDVGYTRRGSNFISSSAAIDLNGGRGHVIEQNRIEGEWSRGVYLYGNVSKVTVLNNTLVGITNSGAATGVPLDIEAGRHHRLIGNVITGSEGQGIYIHGARDITLVGNHVEDSAAGVGYQIASTGSVISSNILAQGNVSIGNAKGFWDMDFTDNKSLRIVGNDIQGASTAYDFGDTAAGELTLRTWDTVGGTNQVATLGNLNVASNSLYSAIGSGAGGTNNPVLSASPSVAIIANQTARAMFTTNASFSWTITGASNQSTIVEVELANTSTNTIYATNALAPHVVEYGSNVTTLAIAPTSKLITRSWLNRSNEWVMTTLGAPYALTFSGSGVTLTTNHTTKTVDAAISSSGGGGGAGSLPMNANQFDTNATASLKSGALATNLSARGLTLPLLTASRAMVLNASSDPTNSPNVSATELEYLDGVTAAIQTQFQNITNGQARIADTNWVNVRAYGAVGNGSTDDAAAFAAAFTNPLVYVPAGRYVIGSALYKTNGVVRGDGDSTVLLQNFNGIMIDTLTSSQIAQFEKLQFDGQGAGNYTNAASGSPFRIAIYVNTRGHVEIRHCTFRNYNAESIYAYANAATTTTRDSKLFVFGNNFSNCWTGITLINDRAEYSRVQGNYFDNCAYGIQAGSANALITGNIINDGLVGIAINGTSGNRAHNNVTGNAINHNVFPVVVTTQTGTEIVGNNILGGGIFWLTNASGVNVSGNIFELTEMRFTGGGANRVFNNMIGETLPTITHNYGGSVSRTYMLNNISIQGASVPASPLLTLAAGANVTNNYDKIRVVGSGGAVTLTSTPTVPTNNVPDGFVMRIQGTDNTNTLTVQDDGTLANSDLSLGASTRVLGLGDLLTLQYDATLNQWFEVGWSDN